MNGDGTVTKDEFQAIMDHATSELGVGQRLGCVSDNSSTSTNKIEILRDV